MLNKGKTRSAFQNSPWKRFRRNPLSVASIIVILIFVFLGLLAYVIIPDKTTHANSQHIELSALKPGTLVKFVRIRSMELKYDRVSFGFIINGHPQNFSEHAFIDYIFREDSLVIREFTELPEEEFFYRSFHLADIVFGKMVTFMKYNGRDSLDISFKDGSKRIFSLEELQNRVVSDHMIQRRFLLGTDRFGRDMLSRVILGTRVSLAVGFISVIISLLIGTFLGSLAGYYGGYTDKAIMWLINVIWSVPTLLLVISLSMVLGKGFWQIFIAVGISMWVEVARIVRGQVMSMRRKEFVDAAIVLGVKDFRILFVHILPNILSPLIIIAASNFATAILIEAGLSFLGIGVQPPVPSWGTMIRDHYGFIIVDKAYMAFIPGLAIMLLVLAFTLAGNGLRDAFDVRSE